MAVKFDDAVSLSACVLMHVTWVSCSIQLVYILPVFYRTVPYVRISSPLFFGQGKTCICSVFYNASRKCPVSYNLSGIVNISEFILNFKTQNDTIFSVIYDQQQCTSLLLFCVLLLLYLHYGHTK